MALCLQSPSETRSPDFNGDAEDVDADSGAEDVDADWQVFIRNFGFTKEMQSP